MSDRVSAPIAQPKGGVLNQNHPHLQLHINRVVEWMRASVPMVVGGRRHFVPRFGAASLLLQEMPIFVYDHPVIMEQVADTAFTDYRHIYIAGPFLETLIKSEQDHPGTYEVVHLILHEISHVMLQHNRRLRNAAAILGDQELGNYTANIAMDRAINARLVIGYPQYPWGKVLSDTGHGLDKPEKYAAMMEEEIFREMIAEVNRINREHANQNAQKSSSDESVPQDGANNEKNTEQGSPKQGDGDSTGSEDANQAQNGQRSDPAGEDGEPQSSSGNADGGEGEKEAAQEDSGDAPGGQEGNQDGNSQAQSAGGQNGNAASQGSKPSVSSKGASGGGSKGGEEPSGEHEGDGQRRSPEEQIAEALRRAGKKSPGTGMPDSTSSHTISSKDLARILEENLHSNPELEKVKDALGIPNAADKTAHAQIESRAARIVENAINKRKESGIGDIMPGRHTDAHANDVIDSLNEPKITWTGAVGEIINGAGKTYEKDMDEPHSVFYVDPGMMGLGGALYQGSEVQKRQESVVLVLIDSSGSVSMEMLRSFFSETRGICEGADGGARRLFVYSGDTALRGEPIEVTEDNVSDMLDRIIVPGRGGTDLAGVIDQGVSYLREQEIKVDAIVYFTDLFDYPPSLAKLNELPPPTVFVCPEGHRTAAFASAVADYAEVVEIADDVSVDWELLPELDSSPVPA